MKKILIVIGSLDLGGTEKHLLSILPLLKRKYQIEIYTTSHAGSLLEDFNRNGINVFYNRKSKKKTKSRIKKIAVLSKEFIRFYFFIKKNAYHIIHFFLPGAYLMGGVAACLQKKKNLIMSRRSQNDYQKKHPIIGIIEKILHKKMRFVIANSNRVANQLSDEGVKNTQLRLIYNGVDLERFNMPYDHEFKCAMNLCNDAFVMTIIANLYRYKGHVDLFDALRNIKDKLPPNWVLLCVGRDAGEKRKLIETAEYGNISNNIRFLGERRDIAKIISISDIGLLVSHEEGFSNAVLEMMAGGKPMIVTDVGGSAEVTENGYNGIVITPRATEELGASIMKLVYDDALRKLMGIRALEKVKKNYSLKKCVAEYDKLYQ